MLCENEIKITLLGDHKVGKTSFAYKFILETINMNNVKPTRGKILFNYIEGLIQVLKYIKNTKFIFLI
jgi:GTPase SAR1 family protein